MESRKVGVVVLGRESVMERGPRGGPRGAFLHAHDVETAIYVQRGPRDTP